MALPLLSPLQAMSLWSISVTKPEQSITVTAGENAEVLLLFSVLVAVTISPAFTLPGLTVRVHSPVASEVVLPTNVFPCTGTPAHPASLKTNTSMAVFGVETPLMVWVLACVTTGILGGLGRVMPPAKLQLMLF